MIDNDVTTVHTIPLNEAWRLSIVTIGNWAEQDFIVHDGHLTDSELKDEELRSRMIDMEYGFLVAHRNLEGHLSGMTVPQIHRAFRETHEPRAWFRVAARSLR